MKKVLALVFVLVVITSFSVTTFAAETTNGCTHPNMTVTVEEQPADCYHTYYRCESRTCPDCDYTEMFVTVGNEYAHGEIETINNSTTPTCISQGWFAIKKVCKDCGQVVGGAIQPTGNIMHGVKDGAEYPDCYIVLERAVAGNCDSYGFREKVLYCTECKCDVQVLEKEQLPMSEHFWTEWVIKGEYAERRCLSCGKVEQQEQVLGEPIVVTEIVVEDAGNACVTRVLNWFRDMIEMLRNYFIVIPSANTTN